MHTHRLAGGYGHGRPGPAFCPSLRDKSATVAQFRYPVGKVASAAEIAEPAAAHQVLLPGLALEQPERPGRDRFAGRLTVPVAEPRLVAATVTVNPAGQYASPQGHRWCHWKEAGNLSPAR